MAIQPIHVQFGLRRGGQERLYRGIIVLPDQLLEGVSGRAEAGAPLLPLSAYSAVGFADARFWVPAERIDPDGERVVKTLLALSRTHKVLGEQMLSDAKLTRARALRAQRKR